MRSEAKFSCASARLLQDSVCRSYSFSVDTATHSIFSGMEVKKALRCFRNGLGLTALRGVGGFRHVALHLRVSDVFSALGFRI